LKTLKKNEEWKELVDKKERHSFQGRYVFMEVKKIVKG